MNLRSHRAIWSGKSVIPIWSNTTVIGYKVIQASKERSFAQKVVQLAIDHTFWYHSKAQECVGFNALFDPTYENPWNLGWVDSRTLEFIAGQITRWMTPFANLRALKPSHMLCWSWLSLLLLLLWWISCMFESNMFLEEIHSLYCDNRWWLVAAKFIYIGKPCQYIQSVFTPLWYMELQDGFDWIPLDDFALVRAIHCTRTMPCSFGTTTATNCSRTVQVKRRQGGKKSRMAGEAGRQVWEC